MHKKWFNIQVVTQYIHTFLAWTKKKFLAERTPKKLALACAMGIFIAFWPFIGLHWLLTIIIAWTFRLNIAVIYAAAHVVNNPLTMVPLYLADYAVGLWVCNFFWGSTLVEKNPSWMQWLNVKLSCLGIPNLSLWAFLIGGHILALIVSIVAYPFLMRFFKKIITTPESV